MNPQVMAWKSILCSCLKSKTRCNSLWPVQRNAWYLNWKCSLNCVNISLEYGALDLQQPYRCFEQTGSAVADWWASYFNAQRFRNTTVFARQKRSESSPKLSFKLCSCVEKNRLKWPEFNCDRLHTSVLTCSKVCLSTIRGSSFLSQNGTEWVGSRFSSDQ